MIYVIARDSAIEVDNVPYFEGDHVELSPEQAEHHKAFVSPLEVEPEPTPEPIAAVPALPAAHRVKAKPDHAV
jgi:hypothetical protein